MSASIWNPTTPVLSADVLAALASILNASEGTALVGYNPELAYSQGLGEFLNYTFGRTPSEIAAGITPTNYAYFPGDVRRYGAICDGVNDDTESVQDAGTVAAVAGGTIRFPVPGKCVLTDTITIVSDHAVSLVSEMGPDNSADPESYISIGATIAGPLFDISARGGKIKGLWFRDPTSTLGGAQGTRAIDSALKLTIFGMGTVEDCSWDGILGSALEANNWIRGHIVRPHIRDCGSAGHPSVWFNPSSALSVGQVTITSPHIEVCRATSYVRLEADAVDTKIIGGQFEADTTLAASNQLFIDDAADRTTISASGFNRNTATQVKLGGTRARLTGCVMSAASGAASAPQLLTSGSYNNVSGTDLIGTPAATATAISDTGSSNNFSGVQCYFGGNVILGAKASWTGGAIRNCQTTEAYALVTGAECTVAGLVVTDSALSGGIRIINGATVTGCIVLDNAGIGIRNESSVSSVYGNKSVDNTGANFSTTSYPRGLHPNANLVASADLPVLQYEAAVDPGSLAAGASSSASVTVTGAAVGDTAIVQFPALAATVVIGGIQVSGSVVAANTVRYSITNNSGGVVDLDSGTLVVKVFKK